MLYGTFRVLLMIAAILGTLNMMVFEEYKYIFFPIAIIIWTIYTFFDSNDREYLRRNGIDADEISWFFPDYSDYDAVRSTHSAYAPRGTYPYRKNTYNGWNNNNQYNSEYKGLKDKCKRNFKITVEKK